MNSNLENYKADLSSLIKRGESILKKIKDQNTLVLQRQDFEMWYSESLAVIKIVLPDRALDFSKMYYDDKSKSGIKACFQHVRDTWQDAFEIPYNEVAKSILDSQIGVLKSCQRRFESSLFDIKQIIQADIFETELDAASELNKKGFMRGAGAIAGVVLEGHLAQVCGNHNLSIRKNNPTINDFNEVLKANEIIDVPTWRFIQHLGDLRNLCDHKKQKEPTKENIEELITGVKKITKNLY
jgi:hypothetical protein